jgi:hypothetical protein
MAGAAGAVGETAEKAFSRTWLHGPFKQSALAFSF